MQSDSLIKVEGLVLRFYTYEGIVEALDNVNLQIKPGEILGLVGETGCGKSVTSLSILNIVPPPGVIEGGKIIINTDGKEIDLLKQKEDFLRKVRGNDISMVFQEPKAYLNPVYTVADQIGEVLIEHRKKEFIDRVLEELKQKNESFYLRLYTKMAKNPNALSIKVLSKIPLIRRFENPLKSEIRKEVIKILRSLEIADPERVADMYPHELSGGMAQRVVIAMALACNPKLLICDEPTTNLDVTVQAQILELIRILRQNFKSSILYITHDLGVIAELCERVAVMYAGNVVEIAEVIEIFKKPLHPYTQALLESIPRPGKKFKSIPGMVPSLINPPKACRFYDRCYYTMDICQKIKPKLIEVTKNHFVACHMYGEK
ncbi:MAG: ABC transporter ATP-binding protein [Candidatus Bathyarchaeia archaeon]